MGEGQGIALHQVGLDVPLVDVGLDLVVDEHHHDVAPLGGVGHGHHLQAGSLRLGPALRALPQAHADLAAGILQVQGMGVALGAIADDGDLLAVEVVDVAVFLIVHFCHSYIPP